MYISSSGILGDNRQIRDALSQTVGPASSGATDKVRMLVYSGPVGKLNHWDTGGWDSGDYGIVHCVGLHWNRVYQPAPPSRALLQSLPRWYHLGIVESDSVFAENCLSVIC